MERRFYCSTLDAEGVDSTVAQTPSGGIRGFCWDGVYTFHGIRYATAKRFQKPSPVEKWEGTLDALSYGYTAPKPLNRKPDNEMRVVHRMWSSSEDCLSLNIWTPSIHEKAMYPVLVWLHGGGFSTGSSIEQLCYDGKNLAAAGNAVVVTVNHRLNLLGFLDMSAYGPEFQNSANAGLMDLVEALRWIQKNIASFGGDPDNVTLFGQSGGAMKVMSLMRTPEADSLFHRGVMISGTTATDGPRQDREIIEGLLRHLKLRPCEARKLADVPLDALMDAYRKTEKELAERGVTVVWSPCKNDWYLGNPMTNGFTEGAKKKPLIMAGVFSELNINGQDISDKDGLTREQRLERLKGVFADWTDTLVAAFNEAYPGRDELDLLRLDNLIRIISIDFVNKRAADGCAPTYDVMFTPNFSVENGSPAWHCSDLPFFFHNIDMIPVANGLPNARELEHQISGSLIQFAKTGDPNAEDLLRWPMYDLESKSTLVLDTHCRIGEAYDHKLYQIYTRWMGTKKSVWGYKKNDKTAGIT